MVIKIGAPSIAVRIDTGISAALIVRARVSTIITKHAPQLMHAGSSLAWLFPNKSLHTCGTSSPTQPTCPHIATHEAVIAAQQTMHTARRRGMFVPNVRASSPGSGSRLSFQRRRSSMPLYGRNTAAFWI